MEERALVSVLMTAYNREKYIAEAIESVLASTYTNFELIIVDDCSKDKTVEIAKNYELKDRRIKVYVNEVNLGDYPNRNKAASYAIGKYLKYLDSDDLLYRYSLEAFVYFMEDCPDVAFGVSSLHGSTEKPFPHIFNPSESIRHHFFKKNFLDCAPTGTIINTEAFISLGGFSGKRMIGDIEFGLYCASKYKVMLLPPALIFWREHGEQEVFYGIKNNIYPPMLKKLYIDFFKQLPASILTDDEMKRIWQNNNRNKFHHFIAGRIKKIFYGNKKTH